MKLDILAFGAHPDDVELGAAGTLIKHLRYGRQVGIADLTKGELGTRGSAEIRAKEAASAAKLMGISVRENLGLADGFFMNDKENQAKIIKILRKYQPDIVISTAPEDRHPDHGTAYKLITDSCFLAGLAKLTTSMNKKDQEPWRPKSVLSYIQDKFLEPDLVVDISGYLEEKMEAIKAHKSQFHNPASKEPETYISSPRFIQQVRSRAEVFGHMIGVVHGEGFLIDKVIGVSDLFDLV